MEHIFLNLALWIPEHVSIKRGGKKSQWELEISDCTPPQESAFSDTSFSFTMCFFIMLFWWKKKRGSLNVGGMKSSAPNADSLCQRFQKQSVKSGGRIKNTSPLVERKWQPKVLPTSSFEYGVKDWNTFTSILITAPPLLWKITINVQDQGGLNHYTQWASFIQMM